MTRKTILIGIVLIALAALGAGLYVVLNPGAPTLPVADNKMAVTDYDRTLGSPTARLTLIEYAAPMCPVCARFNANEFGQFKAQYIDTGKVFYVFRVYPIGAPDYPAEGLARCLPKEAYFPFIDMLFRNQPKWDPEYGVTDVHGGLLAMSRIAGMTTETAERCMADKATQARITQNVADAEKDFNVGGTPTFVVDGQVVFVGEYPFDQLKAMLDAKLAK